MSEELRLDLLLGLARRFGHQVDHGVSILNRPFVHTDGSFFYGCGQTDFQIEGFEPDTVTWRGGWDDKKLRELVDAHTVFPGSINENRFDHRLLDRARHLVLNVLIFLSQEPIDYQPEAFLRKPRMEGKHLKSGLVKARFVGDCQPKSRAVQRPKPDKETAEDSTGITRAAHWVRGHWSRVAHGKGRTLRRLTWIHPYRTGEQEHEPMW